MIEKIVNLAGKPIQVIEDYVNVDSIILDSENPRIGLTKDTASQELTQGRIAFVLQNRNTDAFRKLKESIEINHGILHPIWIEHLEKGDGYVVIEGNSRLVVYRELAKKYPSDDTYKRILAIILPKDVESTQKEFIRLEAHLRGTTDWDAYEKARYLCKLFHDDGYSISYLEQMTKLKYDEIDNSIKAFKDMESKYIPAFGEVDQSPQFKFSYFVEFEKDSKLKQLMERQNMNVSDFCGWVGESKIKRAMDVRDLHSILSFEQSKKAFISDGFERAMQELEMIRPDKVSYLFQNIERVINELKNLPAHEVTDMREGIQPQKKKMIQELAAAAHSVIKLIE